LTRTLKTLTSVVQSDNCEKTRQKVRADIIQNAQKRKCRQDEKAKNIMKNIIQLL